MKKRGDRPLKNKVYYLFLILAIILAVVVRTAAFSSIPGGVNQDEAMAAVDAKALADYGTDRYGMKMPVHFQAWGFGQMSVLLSYIMVPFIKVLGFSTFSIRLPMLLVSLAGLACLYFLSKDLFNRDLALIVLLFAAICPWHIVQSRWAIDCNVFPHFFIAGLYFLNHSIKKTKSIHLYLSMIFFGLSMYGYGISIYSVPLFLLFACSYLILSRKVKPQAALICFAIYMLISWPFFAMIIINTFSLSTISTPLFTIPYFPSTMRKADILFFTPNALSQLWANICATFRVIFQIGDDYLSNVVPGFSTLYVFTIPFSLYGFFWCMKNFRKNSGIVLLLLFFFSGIFCGLITNNVNVNRLNIIFYPLIIFNGIGIYRIVRNVKFADMAIEIIFVTAFSLFCCTYFTSYASDISKMFFEDYSEAVLDVDPDKYEKIIITPDVQGPGRWYVSEILTLYYHNVDSKYYQSSNFNKKYTFKNPTVQIISDNPSAAYVVPTDIATMFDNHSFDVTVHGRYASIIPE